MMIDAEQVYRLARAHLITQLPSGPSENVEALIRAIIVSIVDAVNRDSLATQLAAHERLLATCDVTLLERAGIALLERYDARAKEDA